MSNVLGTENDLAAISKLAHDAGALVIADGAQAAPKLAVDVAELGVDFYAFTGHKLYAPTGIGVLWGRLDLLREMPPFLGGGSMIRKVTKERDHLGRPARPLRGRHPRDHPGDRPRRGDPLGRRARHGRDHGHEHEVANYALDAVATVPGLRVFGPPPSPERLGPVSFELEGIHGHDVAEILDRHGVAVRAGHHCAQVLMDDLGVAATTRASFGVYTTTEEIDRLVEGLHDARRVFRLG